MSRALGLIHKEQKMQEKSSVNLMKGLIINDKCSWSPKSWICCAILSKFHPSLLARNSCPSIMLTSKDLHPMESALWLACLQITTVAVTLSLSPKHPFLHQNCQHTNTHIHLFFILKQKRENYWLSLSLPVRHNWASKRKAFKSNQLLNINYWLCKTKSTLLGSLGNVKMHSMWFTSSLSLCSSCSDNI